MRETGGLELASTITLALQANRLTKCASHPTLATLHYLQFYSHCCWQFPTGMTCFLLIKCFFPHLKWGNLCLFSQMTCKLLLVIELFLVQIWKHVCSLSPQAAFLCLEIAIAFSCILIFLDGQASLLFFEMLFWNLKW